MRHLLAPVARTLAALAALAAPTGCYAPSLRDCTVTCDSERDCASGQVCGADGMCAAPEVAGRCAAPEVDAGVVDASGEHDASPPRDAAMITLRVQVDGKGSIDVAGAGVCSSKDPQRGRCMYDIAPGIAQRVEAIAIEPDQLFVSWTSVACAGQDAVCTFVPLATTTVVAKFGRTAGVQ